MTKRQFVEQLKNPKLWLTFVLIAVLVWSFAFYWISQPSKQERLVIWLAADFQLKTDVKNKVFDSVQSFGIKKVTAQSYNPTDAYFPQAFSLQAHSVDIYILSAEFAATVYQTKLFKPFTMQFDGANYLQFDQQNYGVQFVGDYYIFINATSKQTDEVLNKAIEVLIAEAQQ